MVAQGYSQEEGIRYDETFAPVTRIEAIRIFLAFSRYMNFIVFLMDVKSAFLNGKSKEEVYEKQPLGFEIKQDDKRIFVCQEQYTRNLLKKYEISDSSSVKTPMVPPNNMGPDLAGKPVNNTLYKEMIGSLMYLTVTRYLTGTPSLVLWCPKCSGFDLKGYSDSDYSAKKQQLVAMSSADAEYVTSVGCCANILWMKSQLSDYDIHYKMVPIFCDNTSAIAISNNPILHSRTKHIDIRYHFIRDHILKGDIELHFIPTQYQLAGIFTKPLDEPTFTRLKAEDFWCTAVVEDPKPPTDDSETCPFKEFVIKFTVMNGKNPLTLNFKTFCESTGLDYNQGKYVFHPSLEVVKAELAKITTSAALVQRNHILKTSFTVAWRILLTFVVQVLGENYSSTK
ncbi:retrovirus-related pol polyprotein from transposon TNT 1-94 [Tanacetum coccineum]